MRIRKSMILLLQLGEQPHVLDRDDGLVGEGRYQVNLLVGEGTNLSAPQRESTDEHTLPEHRNSQQRAEAAKLLRLGQLILGIRQDIEDMNCPVLQGNPPRSRSAPRV